LFSLFVKTLGAAKPVKTVAINISRGGLCFKKVEGLNYIKGSEVELRLYTSIDNSTFLRIKAQIRWFEDDYVGVEFIVKDPKGKLWIDRLCSFLEVAEFENEDDDDWS
tara:strand:- start:229 stop:552 length:324 start_codon:yes stop_codon:yes gene_type:complete